MFVSSSLQATQALSRQSGLYRPFWVGCQVLPKSEDRNRPSTSPPMMSCWLVGSSAAIVTISPPVRYIGWNVTARKAANANAHCPLAVP